MAARAPKQRTLKCRSAARARTTSASYRRPTVYNLPTSASSCAMTSSRGVGRGKEPDIRSLPKPAEIKNVVDQYVVGQEGPRRSRRGRAQPLQAHRGRLRDGGGEVELQKANHPPRRPHGLARPFSRRRCQDAPRALHHRRCHHPDGGGLCR